MKKGICKGGLIIVNPEVEKAHDAMHLRSSSNGKINASYDESHRNAGYEKGKQFTIISGMVE